MHEIRLTPKTEIDARIRHLQAQLAEEGVDAALIIHHTNMFYYSGTSQSGHLLIPRQGEPLLMVRSILSIIHVKNSNFTAIHSAFNSHISVERSHVIASQRGEGLLHVAKLALVLLLQESCRECERHLD